MVPAAAALAEHAAITAEEMTEHVKVLASDAFEGRKPGTAGEQKSLDYITGQFRALGLEPAVGDSYLQRVPLVEVTGLSQSPLTVKGPGGEKSYDFFTQMITVSRRPEPEQALTDSEVVFVGYGIVAPEYGWNDYAGLDVRGKTVVVLVNDPGFATQDPSLFNGNAMTWYGRWPYKYEEAERQGAAGVLIVHETRAAGYPWAVVTNSWRVPKLDLVPPDGGRSRPVIQGWVQQDVAREMFSLAGQDFDALAKSAAQRGFKPVPLKLTASAAVSNKVRTFDSYNVIGKLTGSKRPDEVVLISAHWDHLGRGPAMDGDDIYNGAMDNATGVAGLIELAEAFAKGERPERTIAFLSYTAEEQGLLGSEYYAKNPVFPPARTVGGFNMDMLNPFGPMRDIVVTGAGKSELEDRLARWAADNGKVVKPEPFPERGLYYRSDHFPLAKIGVPMMFAGSGVDSIEHGEEWGRAQYNEFTRLRYHTPHDEWLPGMDLTGAVDDLRMVYDLSRDLANGTDWPSWYKGSEFRAVRETSLKEGR
ncbi:M28 family metallopeptidase [Rhodospirillum centenum]|uniref:Aminopeptidase family M28, putative n=1 Tax=Rhodospirillum centenum (strain ATCC 51521 / SW) TaxID=414684 RepID=B6IPJ4_RHOCS|nr:M28 family metallopeptidase [Rhodospirillum centenum]ACI99696.1 Aminopeptidase family M28, putative [Rhodospirillum centenum SW]